MSNLSSNEILVYNIKYYRLLKNITQAQMAEAIDITEKHYCHLENLKYQLTLKNLDTISKVLKKEPWELLKERHTKEEIEKVNIIYKNNKKGAKKYEKN